MQPGDEGRLHRDHGYLQLQACRGGCLLTEWHPVLLLAGVRGNPRTSFRPRFAATGRQLKAVDAPLPTSCCTGTPVSVPA